jgi:hypothetical protein
MHAMPARSAAVPRDLGRSFYPAIDLTHVWIVSLASSQAMSANIVGMGFESASSK